MKHENDERGEAPYQNPLLARMWTYFAKDVWRHDLSKVGFPRSLYYKTARVLYLATSGFLEDRCFFRASALTYITVVSLVPLLAFAFSMIKGLGAYEGFVVKVRTWIDSWLQSQTQRTGETGEMISNALDKVLGFVNETDVTKLGAVGLVFLLVAVVQMLGTIEGSFNDIWGVKRPRSMVRKLTDYLAMVVLAPIFFVTAVSLTSIAQADSLSLYMRESLQLGGLLDLLLQFTSVFVTWIFFTFLFMTMPNARTRFASALLGGFVSAVLWYAAQLLHVRFQVGMANYNRLYAGFAAIPIFLAWIHVSWVTVLTGAELAFAHQSEPAYRKIARTWPAEHAFQEIVALRAMVRIAKAFLAGEKHPDAIQLSTEIGVPPRPVELALSTLSERGLVAIIEDRGEHTFLPGRDPQAITIKDVLDAMKGSTGAVAVPCRAEVDHRLDVYVRQLDGEFRNSPANRTLRELAQSAE